MKRSALIERIRPGIPAKAWDQWAGSTRGLAWLDTSADEEAGLLPAMVDGVMHVYAYGPVDDPPWGFDAKGFVLALREAAGADMVVHIDSPGGVASYGQTINSLLREYSGATTARVEGLCASAATMIATGCDKRVMTDGSQFMIHEATRLIIATASTIDAQKEHLMKLDAAYSEEYARVGNGDAEHYLAAMRKETWMNADEAVGEGLAERTEAAGDHDKKTRAMGLTKNRSTSHHNHELPLPREETAMNDAEKAQLDKARADAAAAEKQVADLQAKLAKSEHADALAESAKAVADAEARAKAAEAELAESKAAAAKAEVDAKVAKYAEGHQALARAAIESGNEDAIKALEGLNAKAEQSTKAVSDPKATDSDEETSAWTRFNDMVAETSKQQGITTTQAQAVVRATAPGRQLMAEMAEARLRKQLPADFFDTEDNRQAA